MSSIDTDGIAISFSQSRMNLKKYKVTAKELKNKEEYIDDSSINPSEFKDMTLAAVDPGKSDLLYFSANLATGMTHSKIIRKTEMFISGTLKINENLSRKVPNSKEQEIAYGMTLLSQ
ncbi:hypothetical protein P9112_014173 [Eukaryota sp. TZLM1-RC]